MFQEINRFRGIFLILVLSENEKEYKMNDRVLCYFSLGRVVNWDFMEQKTLLRYNLNKSDKPFTLEQK
jgi:hypothetical protein